MSGCLEVVPDRRKPGVGEKVSPATGGAPEIGVIIPHLNQPDHLRRCLASLQRQDYGQRFDIVVVDNGSQSLPTDVCAAFPRVRLESEATPGPGPARNRGIACSRARLLAFIDADCVAHPAWLSALAAALARPGCEVVGGDVRIAFGDARRLTALEAYEAVFAYRQREYVEKQGFSGTGNLAMRREAYERVGPFAGIHVAEDRDWGRRAGAKGIGVRYVPAMIVFHPARRSVSELRDKWDRQLAHDFEEQVATPAGRLRWLLRAGLVAGSPLGELPRIVASDRIGGVRDRFMAAAIVTRLRAYRARRMLAMLFNRNPRVSSASWNR